MFLRTFCFLKGNTVKCHTSYATNNVFLFLFVVSNLRTSVSALFFSLSKALSWNITAGKNMKELGLKELPKHTIYNTEHKLKPI